MTNDLTSALFRRRFAAPPLLAGAMLRPCLRNIANERLEALPSVGVKFQFFLSIGFGHAQTYQLEAG